MLQLVYSVRRTPRQNEWRNVGCFKQDRKGGINWYINGNTILLSDLTTISCQLLDVLKPGRYLIEEVD